ncbi:hypothetical protein TNCT_738291, partial [Trichonephila clavata]
REQANLVGQRLKDLNPNYTKLVRSTMTRAQETSDIILKHFPDLPVEDCDLLRESRIDDAFKKHFHRANENQTSDSHEIIVCHENVIRYCICRLHQFPPEAWLRLSLHHCSISWITIFPTGRVKSCMIGDSGFLPESFLTA